MSPESDGQHVSRLPRKVIQVGILLLILGLGGTWLLDPSDVVMSAPLSTLRGLLVQASVVGLVLILVGLLGVVMRDVQREQTNRVLVSLDLLTPPSAEDHGDFPRSHEVVARTSASPEGSQALAMDADDSRWRPPSAADR